MTNKLKILASILISVVALVVLVTTTILACIINSEFGIYDERKVFSLQVNSESKDFKILQLTDTHISDISQLDYMQRSVEELVNATNPDLIIITGDGIWKKNTGEVLPKYVELMDEFGIPWSYLFGNHDFEGSATLQDYVDAFAKSKYCIFDVGPENVKGNCNFSINIKDGKNIVYSLIMLDSHSRLSPAPKDTDGKYDHISQTQVDWYEWNIKGVSRSQYGMYNANKGKVVPSLMFYHVPQVEFIQCRTQMIQNYGLNTPSPDGSIATETDDNVATDLRLYPSQKSNIVDKAIALKSTKAMFVGHLHRDRSNYNYKGIELVQGTKTLTTYSYFGCLDGEDQTLIGGNLITLNSNGDYSWQRIYSTIIEPEWM